MISKKCLRYCCEDLSLIENYEKAINDTTQTWHCHHCLETDSFLTRDELKKQDLYYNRPASELIFLTPSEHHSLHKCLTETKSKIRNSMMGKQNAKGYIHSEQSKEIQSKKMKNIGRSKEYKNKCSSCHIGRHRIYDNEEHTKWHMTKRTDI